MADQLVESVEQREYEKGEAKKHLNYLYSVDLVIKELAFARDNYPDSVTIMGSILTKNSELLSKATDINDFVRSVKVGQEFSSHDLRGMAGAVEGFLVGVGMMPEMIKEVADVDPLLADWDRYKIAVEDILLRILGDDEVPKEFQKSGVGLVAIEKSLAYLKDKEVLKLVAHQVSEHSDEQDAYRGVEHRKLTLPSNEDWIKIEQELAGKKINGNTGVVGNFLLNELRNCLKHDVGANSVELSVRIEDDALVIVITDDGHGMMSNQLSEGSQKFIFTRGVSGTKSTGLGVAGFHKRLFSMDGGLRVYSKNDKTHEEISYKKSPKELKFGNEQHISGEHGTSFEIRLPITNIAE